MPSSWSFAGQKSFLSEASAVSAFRFVHRVVLKGRAAWLRPDMPREKFLRVRSTLPDRVTAEARLAIAAPYLSARTPDARPSA
jgi:hypothetical protein